MDCFLVDGGTPLDGRVAAAGSKNAALPILASALLLDGPAAFSRVPLLRDIDTMRELLEALGVRMESSTAGGWTAEVVDSGVTAAPYEIVRRMRASVCVLGPLLARRGRAEVPLPGGCVLGARPIDVHIRGMQALGAVVELEHGSLRAEAPTGGLRGARVRLDTAFGSSVLGTINVLCAAVLARGESILEGAALEPEVIAAGRWLQACGAQIEGLGSETLRVQGVDRLMAAAMTIPPDRIETGTLLLAAGATRGRVRVDSAAPAELESLLSRLRTAGLQVQSGEDWLEVDARGCEPDAQDIVTGPYPGFPTDLQAQWTAWATTVPGVSRVRDTIYPERFLHLPELQRMGAVVEREADTARIEGGGRLSGAPVIASDLRASAALVLAGMVAEGRTIVRRVYHLDRGYERLEAKLRTLGAQVTRTVDDQKP